MLRISGAKEVLFVKSSLEAEEFAALGCAQVAEIELKWMAAQALSRGELRVAALDRYIASVLQCLLHLPDYLFLFSRRCNRADALR